VREWDGIGDVKSDMKKATLEIQPIQPSRVLKSYLHKNLAVVNK